MTINKLLTLVTCALIGCNQSAYAIIRCDTPTPSESDRAAMTEAIGTWTNSTERLSTTDVVFPVYFHVITNSDGSADIGNQQLYDQLDVLNATYSKTRFKFSFAGVDRTKNSVWTDLHSNTQSELDMVNQVAIDPAYTINVYIVNKITTSLNQTVIGYTFLPSAFSESSKLNRIIISSSTIPGGGLVGLNQGKTLTHEIGHYLGLLHTFEGECSIPNDGVEDTPAHKSNEGKPVDSTDSCANYPGTDPVHNYMNYVDDDWMTEFTIGQMARMYPLVASFRPTLWAAGSQTISSLANISTRLFIGRGEQAGVAGFIVQGTGTRNVLIRASGPWLAGFGITPVLANPNLDLYSGQTLSASNDDWKNPASNYVSVNSTPWPPVFDVESALKLNLAAGLYSATVTPVEGTASGIGIVEVYDLQSGVNPNRIINISTRGYVGTGQKELTAGFVISGGFKQVLIRAIGPTLSSFGISAPVANPHILITNLKTGQVINENNNWNSSYNYAGIIEAMQHVWAFSVNNNLEAMMLCNLAPGSYSVSVSPETGSMDGIGIVEIYDVNAY